MVGTALRHFIERAIDAQAADLDRGFPASFDWQRLCRDAPRMAESVTEGAFDASDPEMAEALQAQVDVAFRVAHVTALAVLCVAEEWVDDPEAVLDGFGQPAEDEEEEHFGVLASELLGPAEQYLHDEETQLDDRGYELQRLFAEAWPLASEHLVLSGLFGEVDGSDVEPAAAELHPLLAAAGRLATLLAALRWLARYPEAE